MEKPATEVVILRQALALATAKDKLLKAKAIIDEIEHLTGFYTSEDAHLFDLMGAVDNMVKDDFVIQQAIIVAKRVNKK